MKIIPGLYERVIDQHLLSLLQSLPKERVEQEALDTAESHLVLAQYTAALVARALERLPSEERLIHQVALCNDIIQLLAKNASGAVVREDQIAEITHQRLLSIRQPPIAGQITLLPRPETPLALSSLLTGTRVDPSLVSQLRTELKTTDRLDILCSFIKWSGIRILEEELLAFTARSESRLRIITTSYMGATDVKAVEFLRELPRTEIKLSYDTQRTRLHAKAYMFHRETGFGTAYVGSSNLSHAALTEGLEWNVKLSQYEAAHLWEKIGATFETYWNDSEFVVYTAKDRERLAQALAQERMGAASVSFSFDIHPYPYQQEILDKLEAERTYHNRWRNLLVAATGTGKTVIAALDYKRFRQSEQREQRPARLLFIAHRREILEQSLNCFRAVLRDPNFGELLVGPHEAKNREHLFVSIQSYNSQRLWLKTTPGFYDYIVLDETHRIGAATLYQNLLAHIQPKILLGLTATPERADGQSILSVFRDHISAEIRLPAAINRKLLCPFQYFGITDVVDLQTLTWQRGGYSVQELDQQYTGNDSRADLIVRRVQEKLLDVHQARGLGFCVSVSHAQYMAAYFQRSGIPALALSAASSEEERNTARQRLVTREVNFIFVVDLYNEGVDIPEIDTVLFLRPTESLTVFLQQLGRGLRLCDDKECLTVLDFIGQANRRFNFEVRFRALLDHPKRRLDREIQEGSVPLPAGCTLSLEKVAQSYVLDNIRRALDNPAAGLSQRIQSFEGDTGQAPTLSRFLQYYEMKPDDLYRRNSWTNLCTQARVREAAPGADAAQLAKGLRRLAHIGGPIQLQRLPKILQSMQPVSSLNTIDQHLLTMLHLSLWGEWKPDSLEESLLRLRQNPDHLQELLELLAYRYDEIASVAPALTLPFLCPLELHAAYTRDEVLSGLGYWTIQTRPAMREGVVQMKHLPADVFFVTLNKTEESYSPTTMYADYAINERLFHWQSQSQTSESSVTGQRYIHHARKNHTLLLFVREDKTKDNLAQPYLFLGPVTYQSHSGSRPMNIELELSYPIPARLLATARRLAIS